MSDAGKAPAVFLGLFDRQHAKNQCQRYLIESRDNGMAGFMLNTFFPRFRHPRLMNGDFIKLGVFRSISAIGVERGRSGLNLPPTQKKTG